MTTLQLALGLLSKQIAVDAWTADYSDRGTKVKQYRDYVDGDQDAKLTKNRLEQLNLPIGTKSAFQANYCDKVVQTFINRIVLEKITSDNDTANKWVDMVWDDNSLDELQIEVHEAAIRDGDTYVMVSTVDGKPVISHEPAWDGSSGMMVFYLNAGGRKTVTAAIKVWTEMDVLRVNIYYSDRIEKFSNAGGNGLKLLETLPWLDRNRAPLGVPVVHFRNRAKTHEDFGLSELENIIPLQDALNRTIHSMVMAGEFTAFQMYYTIGLPAPNKIQPGSIWEYTQKTPDGRDQLGLDPSRKTELGTFPQGDLAPFINECMFFIEQIGFISNMPSKEMMASSAASGDALKERESELLGKVRRFETSAGSRWRKVFDLAWSLQNTFGEIPPMYTRLYPDWQAAEMRNDAELVSIAKSIRDDIPRDEFLRLVGVVWGWDDAKIKSIIQAKAAEENQLLAAFQGQLPEFTQQNQV